VERLGKAISLFLNIKGVYTSFEGAVNILENHTYEKDIIYDMSCRVTSQVRANR